MSDPVEPSPQPLDPPLLPVTVLEESQVLATAPIRPDDSRIWRRFIVAVLLMPVGMAALFVLALIEFTWLDELPWSRALAGPAAGEIPGSLVAARVMPVSLENFPEQVELVEELDALELTEETLPMEALGFRRTESMLMAEIPADDLDLMLLDGRLPDPGKPEVLAGDLCRINEFTLGNIHFTVTGRLKPGIGVMTFTYLLPRHPAWELLYDQEPEAIEVWIHPDGKLDPVGALIQAGLLKEEDAEDPEALGRAQEAMLVYEGSHLHSATRTHPALAASAIGVLMILMFLSVVAHTQLFLLGRTRGPRFLRGLFVFIGDHRKSWYAVHFAAYGVFVGFMLAGQQYPLAGMQMMDFVRAEFTDGDLAYIGEAYQSGNVLAAANATWQNNYLLQTLVLTIAISLPPIALGFAKTLLSLGMVGFAMAPIWTDVIGTYVLHAGTMVLEIEPYVLVAYVVLLWPIMFVRGLFVTYDLSQRARLWFRLVLQSAIVTGVLLYIAALYEAFTLIKLAGLDAG